MLDGRGADAEEGDEDEEEGDDAEESARAAGEHELALLLLTAETLPAEIDGPVRSFLLRLEGVRANNRLALGMR